VADCFQEARRLCLPRHADVDHGDVGLGRVYDVDQGGRVAGAADDVVPGRGQKAARPSRNSVEFWRITTPHGSSTSRREKCGRDEFVPSGRSNQSRGSGT
jgi:hypothetical protein